MNSDPTSPSSTFGQDASFRLEQPVGSMSISPSGRDVVLASKEGLHIIDLDSPYSPPRYLPHRTPWEVADVQWSPFASRDYWIVSTSNQKALVWNVERSDRDAIAYVLHGHSRAITDINFSAYHQDVLATCAVDSFVHGWDLRAPNRPAFSFSDWFAGATQVKFSRQDEHVIASSHDRFLHIWDKRKGAYPARTIEAHGTKIYGIDWNRFEPTKIVTCSLDRTIKFWDTSDPEDKPQRVIETSFPVWRARHTPFGWGLLVMPQRGQNNLHLYDRRPVDGVFQSGQVEPVTTFPGHKGQVKEFLWRARGTVNDGIDHRDFQLVSWGTDRELRLHSVPDETFGTIGYEKGLSKPQRLNFTRRGAKYRTFRDGVSEPYSPAEFNARTDSFPSQSQYLGARPRPSTNVGMSKVAVSQFRGWLHSGRKERRTGMHGRGTVRQDMNPIAWMKNVKIPSRSSDSLADEITFVGEKFKRVEFESVEIGQRKAVMSLQGPWGEDNAMVYMRVDLRFPEMYPRESNAVITVQKTNAIDPATHRMLLTEVHTIAETYKSRGRGCIEAVVRYLLCEQSMEQVVEWILRETSADSKILDDEVIDEALSSDSDDDNLNGAADPSNSSANIRMPLPKACGAMWSNDGRLVCFFPRKPKEPESVLSKLGTSRLDTSQPGRLFESFGRLKTDSSTRRPVNGTQGTKDGTASDSSDDSSTFSDGSSSSSSDSEEQVVIGNGFTPYMPSLTIGLRHHSRSEERSTTFDGTKMGEDIRLSTVSIRRDTIELLPSRRQLALDYRVKGNGKDVCNHNADVADRARRPDVASVWRLAGLILEQRVPLAIGKIFEAGAADIVLIARRSVQQLGRKDSAVDLASDARAKHTNSFSKAQNRWGASPLASGYLVSAMFNYFERMADVQMLAALSSVFMHTSENSESSETPRRTMKTAIRSRQYYPSADVALSVLRPTEMVRGNSFVMTEGASTNGSGQHLTVPNTAGQHRRRLTFQSDSSTQYSPGQDGVGPAESLSESRSNKTIKSISTSASPEDYRIDQRMYSGPSFAASRASLNALTQSYANSPPVNVSTAASSLKRLSPSASLSAGGWAGNLFYREGGGRNSRVLTQSGEVMNDTPHTSNIRSSISSVSLHDLRRDSQRATDASRGSTRSLATVSKRKRKQVLTKKKVTTHINLHNQDHFDLDGYADKPLLDSQQYWKYRAYRACYAELLGVWELWIQRAELLQSEYPVNTQGTYGERKVSNKTNLNTVEPRLDIVRCCQECGDVFAPIEKNGIAIGWHCTSSSCLLSTRKISKNQLCSICQKVVKGLTLPCLQCGHTTCYDCGQLWFTTATSLQHDHPQSPPNEAKDQPVDEIPSCPTGCGCPCATINIKVPNPPPSAESLDKITSLQTPDPPSMHRQHSETSERPFRYSTDQAAPDTALAAMKALSSRSRAPSTANRSTAAESEGSYDDAEARQQMDELMPWASSRFTSLGRGIGGGLSRGLSNKSSDATIRKA